MTGNTPRSKRLVTFCTILFFLALIPLFLGDAMSTIRGIQFMQIMAAGVALGVMITAIGHHLNSPAKQSA